MSNALKCLLLIPLACCATGDGEDDIKIFNAICEEFVPIPTTAQQLMFFSKISGSPYGVLPEEEMTSSGGFDSINYSYEVRPHDYNLEDRAIQRSHDIVHRAEFDLDQEIVKIQMFDIEETKAEFDWDREKKEVVVKYSSAENEGSLSSELLKQSGAPTDPNVYFSYLTEPKEFSFSKTKVFFEIFTKRFIGSGRLAAPMSVMCELDKTIEPLNAEEYISMCSGTNGIFRGTVEHSFDKESMTDHIRLISDEGELVGEHDISCKQVD